MSFSFYGCPMFVLSSKLRALKAKLKEWNWREFGDIYAKLHDSLRVREILLRDKSRVRWLALKVIGTILFFTLW
ncbi:unnamed protein product [Prunus brigantina]